jgi:putative Mg2+ transporter-C (MgtC) family protein
MIRELTVLSVVIRALLSTVLGGLIGMERGMKNRPAGFRTYMLVCLGSCIVMMTNQYTCQVFLTGDPTRMAAQVISGIGFLGAGTIIVTRRSQIKGLTTAAGLWAAATMGLAVGIGFYEGALFGALLIILILSLLHELDNRLRKRTHQIEAYIELKENVPLGRFIRYVRTHDIDTSNLQLENDFTQDAKTIAFVVTFKCRGKQRHEDILSVITAMDGLAYIEEL